MDVMDGPTETISNRIRRLSEAGHSRAEIARLVNRSYQQVRQVLVNDAARGRPSPQRVSEVGVRYDTETRGDHRSGLPIRIAVAGDGSVTLPAGLVRRLGASEGRFVIGTWTATGHGEDTLTLMGPAVALEKAREGLPVWQPGEPLWSEELIAERRAEAAREAADD